MRKLYLLTCSFFMLIASATGTSYVMADGKKPPKADTAKLVKVFTNKNDKS